MGIGSGLSSQLGFVAESTYGTYVAPTKFIPVSSFEIKRQSFRSQGEGIRVGGLAPLGALHGETHSGSTATAAFEVTNRGLGLLFKALMGGTPTPTQQGGTTAYQTTFNLADTSGLFYTFQGGVPYATPGGAVRPFSLLGGKITSIEFSCRVGELLKASVEIDGQGFTTAQSLATASFATGLLPWTFQQATVKAGTFNSETTLTNVKGFSVRIERPYDTERYYLGGGALKGEPALNGFTRVTGSLDVNYTDEVFVNHVAQATAPSMVFLFEGATNSAGTGYKDTFKVTIPQSQVIEGNPSVSGPGTVGASFSFSATDDGTNAAVILTTINKDTAL